MAADLRIIDKKISSSALVLWETPFSMTWDREPEERAYSAKSQAKQAPSILVWYSNKMEPMKSAM